MKLLSVSDYVVSTLYDNFDAERFPKIDLILSCGDLPPEYLSHLFALFNVPLYYVRGNHDFRYNSKAPDGCIDLNNQGLGPVILSLFNSSLNVINQDGINGSFDSNHIYM